MKITSLNLKFSVKIILIILGIVIFFGISFFLGRASLSKNQLSSSSLITPLPTLAKKEVNQKISLDSKTKEKIKVTYLVESVELKEEILVKGEKLRPLTGKGFLIFNLKIVNESEQGIKINCRDFIRLSVNNSEEWLAPEIHNDPVEVQAISTKYTRLGFVINLPPQKFKVRLGEISGEKVEFELSF